MFPHIVRICVLITRVDLEQILLSTFSCFHPFLFGCGACLLFILLPGLFVFFPSTTISYYIIHWVIFSWGRRNLFIYFCSFCGFYIYAYISYHLIFLSSTPLAFLLGVSIFPFFHFSPFSSIVFYFFVFARDAIFTMKFANDGNPRAIPGYQDTNIPQNYLSAYHSPFFSFFIYFIRQADDVERLTGNGIQQGGSRLLLKLFSFPCSLSSSFLLLYLSIVSGFGFFPFFLFLLFFLLYEGANGWTGGRLGGCGWMAWMDGVGMDIYEIWDDAYSCLCFRFFLFGGFWGLGGCDGIHVIFRGYTKYVRGTGVGGVVRSNSHFFVFFVNLVIYD